MTQQVCLRVSDCLLLTCLHPARSQMLLASTCPRPVQDFKEAEEKSSWFLLDYQKVLAGAAVLPACQQAAAAAECRLACQLSFLPLLSCPPFPYAQLDDVCRPEVACCHSCTIRATPTSAVLLPHSRCRAISVRLTLPPSVLPPSVPLQEVVGQTESFVEHIQLGVREAAADPEALLLFSGGKTRRLGMVGWCSNKVLLVTARCLHCGWLCLWHTRWPGAQPALAPAPGRCCLAVLQGRRPSSGG